MSVFKRIGERLAPRTVQNIRTLSALDESFDQGSARFISYEKEIRALRREIDELRRDNRRVAELYDAVFEWAKQDAVKRGTAPYVDEKKTIERVSKLEEKNQ